MSRSNQADRKKNRTTAKMRELPTKILVPTSREIAGYVLCERDVPISALLGRTNAIAGYTRGCAQVGESDEKYSNNCGVVGRMVLDSLQHKCINSQSVSENPRDSASRGFLGRPPPITAATGVLAAM